MTSTDRPVNRPSAAFSDLLEINTKWHGDNLILVAKRRGGRRGSQHVEDFETKSGRLTLIGADLFDVSYFRHTGQWWTFVAGFGFLPRP